MNARRAIYFSGNKFCINFEGPLFFLQHIILAFLCFDNFTLLRCLQRMYVSWWFTLLKGADRNLQREMRETVIHFIGCKANYVWINENQQTFQVYQLSSWEKKRNWLSSLWVVVAIYIPRLQASRRSCRRVFISVTFLYTLISCSCRHRVCVWYG